MERLSERSCLTPTHANQGNLNDGQSPFAGIESKALVSSIGAKKEQPGGPYIRIIGPVHSPQFQNVPKRHIGLTDETLSSIASFHEFPEIVWKTNAKNLFGARDLLVCSSGV